MRKRVSVLLSFVLVLMLSVSFSLPVNATSTTSKRITIGIGDTSYDYELGGLIKNPYFLEQGKSGNIFHYCDITGSTNLLLDYTTPSISSGAVQFNFESFWLSLRDVVPAGTILHYEVIYDLACNVSADIEDVFGSTSLVYPQATDLETANYIYDSDLDSENLVNDMRYIYQGSFSTPVDIASIELDFNPTAYIIPRQYPFTARVKVVSVKVWYTQEITEQDILVDIRNNTAATTDAVNNQTDTLANGYNNSQMNNSNQNLSNSMNEYNSSETQLTDQSVGFIDDVTFFDPTTHMQLLTCVTFASSWLQSLFVSLGDWGILIMISLSLTFGLMLVGWFKYRK